MNDLEATELLAFIRVLKSEYEKLHAEVIALGQKAPASIEGVYELVQERAEFELKLKGFAKAIDLASRRHSNLSKPRVRYPNPEVAALRKKQREHIRQSETGFQGGSFIRRK